MGLKVFDPSLKFDKNELSVLAKGPKFMVREKLSGEEFDVELEKMVVKDKFDKMFRNKDDHRTETPENIGPVRD